MPYASLRELLTLCGLGEPDTGMVEITGADPVLQTPYRMGTTAAAVIAATGVAASDLWALRTDRRQRVWVDMRAATAAFRSYKYLRVNGGAPTSGGMDTFSNFYRVRDGRWIFLHCNFAHLRDAALRVVGAPADSAAMAKAIEAWDGEELETAIHTGGGCAAFVRTEAEWARHPHAIANAALPLLEIVKIADSPPEPLPAAARPLSGIRALDLTRVLAGPTCARTLAEHGADVLKVTGPGLAHSGQLELDTGQGKLSAQLDLRQAEGREALRGLLRSADVFSQAYRPGTLAERGFSPEDVAAIRPGIIYVTLSAWGHVGPWSRRRGFDTIVQSASGMADVMAKGGTPQLQPVSAIDYVNGYAMAFGAMVALARRAREGGSWLVRASLASGGRWINQRGRLDAETVAKAPADLTADDVRPWLREVVAPDGRIAHLGPVLSLSETPPHWARPPVPLAHHQPVWPG
jgi:crotonobetainyl-CoA:carnitine CoA-transferase CaiB-like acyl-CoA transferase